MTFVGQTSDFLSKHNIDQDPSLLSPLGGLSVHSTIPTDQSMTQFMACIICTIRRAFVLVTSTMLQGCTAADPVLQPMDVSQCCADNGADGCKTTVPCAPGHQMCPPGPFGDHGSTRHAPQFHVRDESCRSEGLLTGIFHSCMLWDEAQAR